MLVLTPASHGWAVNDPPFRMRELLRNGISYGRLEKFPPDFHNTFYERDLIAVRANGAFNQEWWDRFFPLLKSWKATRNGPADNILTTYAQARFESLSNIWSAAVAPHPIRTVWNSLLAC